MVASRGAWVLHAIAIVTSSGCASFMGLGEVEPPPVATFTDVVMEAATELFVEGADLFWTTQTSVRTCALAACVPTTLVGGLSQPRALEVEGAEVRYANQIRGFRIPRTGAATAQELITATGNGQVITDFVRTDNIVYYVHDRLTRCNYDGSAPCTSDSAEMDEVSRTVTVDAMGRVIGTGKASGVMVLTEDTQDVRFTLPTATVPRALIATPSSLFVLQTSDDVLEWPAAVTSSVAGAVALSTRSPSAIAVDGPYLWVASASGELWRRPVLAGSDAELVATATSPIQALATTGDGVIVALPDRIAFVATAP